MRTTIRFGTFETNSSSTHALIILGQESSKKLREGGNLDIREFLREDSYDPCLDEPSGDEATFVSDAERAAVIWDESEGTAPGVYGEPDASCESGIWTYSAMVKAINEDGGGDVHYAELDDSADGIRFEVEYG